MEQSLKPVFIAAIGTETNTFASIPSGELSWKEGGTVRREGSLCDPEGVGAPLLAFRVLATADGLPVVESVCANATPGGPTSRAVFERHRDELLSDLAKVRSPAMVLLALHGAMIADGFDDCEGEIIGRVRELVGPHVPIGVGLDPHCHLTRAMIDGADICIAMKEYPHIDWPARASEIYAACRARSLGGPRPVAAVFDCHMVGFYPTGSEPMKGIVRMAVDAERERGMVSVSIVHGFPWADQSDAGTKVLAYAERDRVVAKAVAERIGAELYAVRHQLLPCLPNIPEALQIARTKSGLTLLADMGDNPGGGAPGDSTFLLSALIEAQDLRSAFAAMHDPSCVRVCFEAGRGARLPVRIGGKLGVASGTPLDLDIEIMALHNDHGQNGLGRRHSLGQCAWVRAGSVDIVICAKRCQVFDPEIFTGLGIEISDHDVVAVKSSGHFRTSFAPLVDRIVSVATPGALDLDFARIPYRERSSNFYPKRVDPLGRDVDPPPT